MPKKAEYFDSAALWEKICIAKGQSPADVVLRGAKFLDVFGGGFHEGDVAISGEMIVGTKDSYEKSLAFDDYHGCYLVPGFIDAHVHIESSLMTPARFQEAVLPCGTTTVIWDPHEIANVKGIRGIQWALDSVKELVLDVFVMLPSCVPSTVKSLGIETSGAELLAADLLSFRAHPQVLGLAEMMNFPGVLSGDPDVLAKINGFKGLKLDGHCPGLTGKELNAYAVTGIQTCHESTSMEEAREKMQKGVHVLVREGSCAKDADALLPLLGAYTSSVMSLCSDDRNPLDIAKEGHIDWIISKALQSGHAPDHVFRSAAWAPAQLFGLLDRGAIAPGYLADLVVVRPKSHDHWESGIEIVAVYKKGKKVLPNQLSEFADSLQSSALKPFSDEKNIKLSLKEAKDFSLRCEAVDNGVCKARVIGVLPHAIITESLEETLEVKNGMVRCDLSRDVLKIAVFERHHGSERKAIGFVKGFGLKSGAIATTINHDAHHIIVVGSSDQLMAEAVSQLIQVDGGIVVVTADGNNEHLALPIGGLMTMQSPKEVAECLGRLKSLVYSAGCILSEPFLQLSFLALPVIPKLKITDCGLFDVEKFAMVSVICD